MPSGSCKVLAYLKEKIMNQSNLRTMDAAHLANLSRALVGFDRYFNGHFANTNGNYPPHNIVKYNETHYGIEVAVAGFSKEEISVEVDQDQLTITGKKISENDNKEYLHRGLAARDFEQTYTLAEYMTVKGAEVKDGMLKIEIERVVPDALKPRQITIK
jgi:molecular chaperone IbpA